MRPIAVFVRMLEFVEGVVLRVEQFPVAPHERLVEHWVFHGHPRVAADRPGVGSGFSQGTEHPGGCRPPESPQRQLEHDRNVHRRTGMPLEARYSFASDTEYWP